jgi:hypothetical protein
MEQALTAEPALATNGSLIGARLSMVSMESEKLQWRAQVLQFFYDEIKVRGDKQLIAAYKERFRIDI